MPTSTFKLCTLCNLKIKDEELESHRHLCRNEIVPCPTGCGDRMQRYLISYHAEFECKVDNCKCKFCSELLHADALSVHEEECGFSLVECGKCGFNVQRCKMVDHLKSSVHSSQSVTCYYCGQLMTQIELGPHVLKCDLCLEDCEKCGVKIQRVYMHFHLKESCGNRAVQCEYCRQELVANQLAHHLEVCELIPIYCENKCGEEFERRKLVQHMHEECPKRMIQCEYCVKETVAQLLDAHYSSCMKLPVGCPETCGADVLRENLHVHLDKRCTKRFAKCSYANMQCSYAGFPAALRYHMQRHLTDHTNLMKKTIENLSEVMNKQKETISFLENKVRETSERLQKEEQQKTDLRKKLRLIEMKFSDITSKFNQMVQEGVTLPGDFKEIREVSGNTRICENKSFVWKISEFSRKLALYQAGQSVQSRTFYSFKCGYKLRINLFPNGENNATGYMSVFLYILSGDYDPLLEWPFKRTVTIKLLVRRGGQPYVLSFVGSDDESFRKPEVNKSNIGRGHARFIAHKALKKYIFDDTIFLEVSVD